MQNSREDEFDYMSDTFITEQVKEDVRPGLLKNHSERHHHEIFKKKLKRDEINKNLNPSYKVTEAKKREEGLNMPIACDNIGFKIMEKFGFQPGTALGKSGIGRTEPVSVTLKTDRQGLGRQVALKEVAQLKAKHRKEAAEKLTNIADYRARLIEQAAEKRDIVDLKRSQRACRDLDQQNHLEPEEIWFWPEDSKTQTVKIPSRDDNNDDDYNDDNNDTLGLKQNEEDESDEEITNDTGQEFSAREKLEMLTIYLRSTYFYCVWCGTTYDNEVDLNAECPGPSRDEH